jgi:drug/metabolite transporter (DMT)-like permease
MGKVSLTLDREKQALSQEKDISLTGLAHLFIVYVVWGSTYLAIRVGVREGSGFPPFTFGAFRIIVAGAVLLLLGVLRRKKLLPTKQEWLTLVGSGLLLWIGGNGLVLWAEQHIGSGIAALIVASVPIWVAGGEALLDRRLPSYRLILFLVIGLGGIVLLSSPVWNSGITTDILGILLLFLASFSWGWGMILQSRRPVQLANIVSAGYQQLTGGLVFMLLGFLTGEPRPTPSPQAWAALGYLIVFGSLLAFTSFVTALQLLPTPIVITYSYVNPVIAVFLGWMLLDEPISLSTLGGAALVLIGVAGVFRERRNTKKMPTSAG